MLKKLIFLLLSVLIVSPISAKETGINLDQFKQISILDNGRLKPLDTYARSLLLQFSSKDTLNSQPAINWFARLLFIPDATKSDKVFLINSPEIPSSLGIFIDPHRRYSFDQLQPKYTKLLKFYNQALDTSENDRSLFDNEVIRLVDNLRLYSQMTYELQLASPDEDFDIKSYDTAKALGFDKPRTYSFLDISFAADKMRQITKGLTMGDAALWNSQQKDVMLLLRNMYQWSNNYKEMNLRILPIKDKSELWISPWDSIGSTFQQQETRDLLRQLQYMTQSYRAGNQLDFDLATRAFLVGSRDLVSGRDVKRVRHHALEITSNNVRPFFFSKILYILAFILVIVSFINSSKWIYLTAWGVLLSGFILHIFGITARIIIMSRPPVSTLFETFIFVAFVTVLLGIIIEIFNKRWLGIVVAAISGTALLFIASKYSVEGDTMKMLVAVLNSNFWLGTHVLTIAMGYGAACVAGVVGHLWLIQRAFKPADTQNLDNTHKILVGMLGLALTLTFIGTNLGGIWADQSWGRFWGWDPKENGALMIVIWIAIWFHAKFGGIIRQFGLAVSSVFGMVVVMWAWFGVNLLSIGLHSYGFTSGIALSLAVYVALEIVFIAVFTFLIKFRSSSNT